MEFISKKTFIAFALFALTLTAMLTGCSSGSDVNSYSDKVTKIFEPLKDSFNELDVKRDKLAEGDLTKPEADELINDTKSEVAGARAAFNDLKTPEDAKDASEELISALDSFDKGLVLIQDASDSKNKIKRSLLLRSANSEITRGFKIYNDALKTLENKDS